MARRNFYNEFYPNLHIFLNESFAQRYTRSCNVRGTFPLLNKAPTGGSSCRGLCCRILPELTGKLQYLLRREQFIERVAFRLVYKVALWRSIFAGDAIEIA